MQVEFHGKITNGRFLLNRPKVFDAYMMGLKDGNYYIEIYKNQGPMKTNEQLGYFHAVVVPAAMRQIIEDGNESIVVKIGKGSSQHFKEVPITEDNVVNILKGVWAKTKGVKIKSKADMTKEECSELIDISIRWCARYLHCVIPPPL